MRARRSEHLYKGLLGSDLAERLRSGFVEKRTEEQVERLMKAILTGTVALMVLVAAPAFAQDDMLKAKAAMKGPDGADLGIVTFTQTPAGVLISADLKGLPPGVHGFHLHEKGDCGPPFTNAGGHFNPTGAEHGFLAVGGPHAGDMPNIHVPDSGSLSIEILKPDVTLAAGAPETLLDDDGTSLVIHAGADDYKSAPSGMSGDRIACGVVER